MSTAISCAICGSERNWSSRGPNRSVVFSAGSRLLSRPVVSVAAGGTQNCVQAA